MNLRLIEHFVTVAELGSLSKAGARLGVAQPSLSRSLRQLEAELAVTLFYRHGRGLSLTDAGRTFLKHSQAALHELAVGRAEVSHLSARPSGVVIVALPPSVGRASMVDLARRFADRLPGATLRLREMFTGEVPEALATGRIDIGVFYQQSALTSTAGERVAFEDLYLVGRSDAPATREPAIPFAALQDLPLILPARQQGVRGMVDAEVARRGTELSVIVELDAMAPLIELMQNRIGYSILPFASVFDLIGRGELSASKIVEPTLTRAILLEASTHRPLSATARATVPLVKEVLRSVAAKARWRPEP